MITAINGTNRPFSRNIKRQAGQDTTAGAETERVLVLQQRFASLEPRGGSSYERVKRGNEVVVKSARDNEGLGESSVRSEFARRHGGEQRKVKGWGRSGHRNGPRWSNENRGDCADTILWTFGA